MQSHILNRKREVICVGVVITSGGKDHGMETCIKNGRVSYIVMAAMRHEPLESAVDGHGITYCSRRSEVNPLISANP